MLDQTEKFPLDFNALQKGQTIQREFLEKLFGAKAGTSDYAFQMMGLIQQIERELLERGMPVTCKQENYEIKILIDVDASAYNHEMFQHALAKMFRTFRRLLGVDYSGFTPDQRSIHERRLENQGKILLSVASITKRQVPTTPYKRLAP